MTVTIYHNPRCSKSRQALQLLQERQVEAEVVEYLKDTPDAETLKHIINQLGISPRELLRTNEKEYKEAQLDDPSLSDDAIIEKMAKYPKVIQRPIVVSNGKAAIGRPPEKVLEIL